MKHLAIAIGLLALTGCGPLTRFSNDVSGNLTPYCYNNVTYLALGEHALVRAWDADGKPLRCGHGIFEDRK